MNIHASARPRAEAARRSRTTTMSAVLTIALGAGTLLTSTDSGDAARGQAQVQLMTMTVQDVATDGPGGKGSGENTNNNKGMPDTNKPKPDKGMPDTNKPKPDPPSMGGDTDQNTGMSRNGGGPGKVGPARPPAPAAGCGRGFMLMTIQTMLGTVAAPASAATLNARDVNRDGRLCVQLNPDGRSMKQFVDNRLP
jgi:hypothetical protein